MYSINKLQHTAVMLFTICTFQYQTLAAGTIDNALDNIHYVPAKNYKRCIEPSLYVAKTLANGLGTAMLATSLALDESDLSIATPPPGLNLTRFKSFMGWFGVVLVGGASGLDLYMASESRTYREKINNIQGVNVQDVNVQGVNVQGVNVQDVNVQDVNVQGVNVQGVNVQGAAAADPTIAEFYDTVDQRRFNAYNYPVGFSRIILGLASGVFGLMFASDQSKVDLSDDARENLALNIALPAAGAFAATMYKELTQWHLSGNR